MKIIYLLKFIFIGFLLSASPSSLTAQVTIGSDLNPKKGTLLDFKESNAPDSNTDKGLLLPRVNLEVKNELYPMFSQNDPDYTDQQKTIHTGLMVYNLTTNQLEGLCPGPYIWNGKAWDRLWDPCSYFEFLCETLGVKSYSKVEGEIFTATNYIFCNPDREINITTTQSFSYGNGLSLTVVPQKIENKTNAILAFYIQGNGLTPSGTYELSLADLKDILGVNISTACKITVNITPATTVFSIDCTGVTASAIANTSLNTTVQIPYKVNNIPYTVPTGIIGGPVNGITAVITNQQVLNTKTGHITVTLTGKPTSASNTPIPITIGGSKCSVSVNVSNTFSLNCTGVSTTGKINTNMTKTVEVPYEVSSVPYTVPTGIIGGPVNGITAVITNQQVLNTPTGHVTVTLTGKPTSDSDFEVPITIGESSCNIKMQMSTPTSSISIVCNDVYVTGYTNVDMSTTTPTAQIAYTLSDGASYSLPAGTIGTHGNIVASVEAQTLNAPSGFINVKFSGISTSIIDKQPFSINIAGSTCSITLSVMAPPADCKDGTTARAFVFKQGSKWYVATTGNIYNTGTQNVGIVRTIECNSEEEALRHPDALQYCGTQSDNRCIRLFDRQGNHVTNVFMSTRSSEWKKGIAEANGGCWQSIIAYGGSRIESTTYGKGYLGAVNLSNGVGDLGLTSETATLTNKPLR